MPGILLNDTGDTCVDVEQLCGRSGRGGHPARAHLLYSPKAVIKDPVLQLYCRGSECRRSVLLRGLGSSEESRVDPQKCCYVCHSSCLYPRVNFPKPVRSTRKRHINVREISADLRDELHSRLVKERNAIVDEHPSFPMIGSNFLCPDSVLDELCARASYVSSVDDLDILCLRPQFRDRFYYF